MKKLLFSLSLVAAISAANAQSFKPFKFDLAVGYAIPGGKGAKGGLLFAGEPKYALNDQITLGLKGEFAFMARASFSTNPDGTLATESAKVQASSVTQLTGDYYFSTNTFRPFAGAGIGFMRFASAGATPTTNADEITEIKTGTSFAATPRAGFEAGHFRMAVEYTIAKDKAGYLGIKLGAFIGGGRLK